MTNPDTSSPTDIERDPAHLAAADWFVRLQASEVSIEDTLAWQAWLKESPANTRAFARIEELSHVLRKVPLPRVACERELASDPYDASVPLKEWKETPTSPLPWMTLALAALLGARWSALTSPAGSTAWNGSLKSRPTRKPIESSYARAKRARRWPRTARSIYPDK